jgi:hypothetical protein
MPDETVVPTPRRIPRTEATITNLGQSYATVTRDDNSGVVTMKIGTVDHRVVLADDPGVLAALLGEAHAQVLEVGRLRS